MNNLIKELSNAVRFLSIDAVEKAKSGHPGLPMGMADVATVLFKYYLRFNPNNPSWINRDRFVLSAGHGSMLLYSLLYLTGYKSISIKDIQNFRNRNNDRTARSRIGKCGWYGHRRRNNEKKIWLKFNQSQNLCHSQ